MAGTYWDREVGFVEISEEVAVDRAEMIAYAKKNDPWPIHIDESVGGASIFGDVTASFGYVVSLFLQALHTLPSNQGPQEGFLGALEWKIQFRRAVLATDRLHVRVEIISKRPTSKGDRGVLTTRADFLNQDGEPTVVIDAVSLFQTEPQAV